MKKKYEIRKRVQQTIPRGWSQTQRLEPKDVDNNYVGLEFDRKPIWSSASPGIVSFKMDSDGMGVTITAEKVG